MSEDISKIYSAVQKFCLKYFKNANISGRGGQFLEGEV
jgi:hypothetical protein